MWTQSEEIPNFQTSLHKSEVSVEQRRALNLGFPVLRCVSLWIQWILPFWQALLEPVIDSSHGQVPVTLCGNGHISTKFFFKMFNCFSRSYAYMGRKNKITGIDKKGSLFSKFTLSLPQRELLSSVCYVSLHRNPTHTGISTGIEGPEGRDLFILFISVPLALKRET